MPVCMGFQLIWRGCRGFRPEQALSRFWVGADGLVIGVGFGVSRLFYNFNDYLIWVMGF
jgi:hypothetical protein